MGKRLADVAVSVVGLVAAAPPMAVVAGAIRVTLGSPVLYNQVRPGRHGAPFVLHKFRTMRDMRDEGGAPLPDADRLTRLGAFLRRWSIDELPELWNVLRGDMSLVGPRPLLPEYTERYTPHQARRLEVKPGLTGLAQVSGRNALSWEERFNLDVWYVDHQSPGLDLKILAATLWHGVTGRGVSARGHATMPEFKGVGRG